MRQQILFLLPILAFILPSYAGKAKSTSTEESSGDVKKWEDYWNKRRSRLAQCKHKKYVKCPSVMARVKTDPQMRKLAEQALKEKRGQNIFIIRFKSQKKPGLEFAKAVLTAYFALIIKKGIVCATQVKRCDTRRYRHQYLPFQLAYAYNSLGDCAFEYGETVKGKSMRKGGFGVRMLCLSKKKMTGELYPVGKSCSACKTKCSSDSLCDGGSSTPPTIKRSRSTPKKKSKKSSNLYNMPPVSTKDSSNMKNKGKKIPLKIKLGAFCEVSNFKGEATGQDGDKIAEYINGLRANVTLGDFVFSGHLLKPIDMFKVMWKDSLGAAAHKLLDTKNHKGTHVPVITFVVKDSDDKMEVLMRALELYFNRFKNHINCTKNHCYNATGDILMELIKGDVKHIGCQVRYSKTGGTSPKMNVRAVVHCETDPPMNISAVKQKIELYRQHENNCAESDASNRQRCSDATYNKCDGDTHMCYSQEYSKKHAVSNPVV